MRKLFQFFCVLVLLISVSNCKSKLIRTIEVSVTEMSKDSNNHLRESEIIVSNQIIVWYPENFTAADRANIRDTIIDEIDPDTPIRKCSCGSQNIELITLNDNVNIEGAIGSVKGKGGGAGVEGENQFVFYLPPVDSLIIDEKVMASLDLNDIKNLSKVSPNTPKVNIAVVDTGIGMFSDLNSGPYLYSTEGNSGLKCPGEISGWSFVEELGNASTAAFNQHGPLVTKIIRKELEEQQINYSILPVKAFDKEGKSSYWKLVCSLAYIKEIQEQNGDIHLVNASFGYDFKRFSDSDREKLLERQKIFKKLIEELQTSTVVVTSSGNEGEDSNMTKNHHYPSGFNTTDNIQKTNMIGVGGYVGQPNVIKTMGNFGDMTIDLAAPFGAYSMSFDIEENPDQKVVLNIDANGTSYGTAFTTAEMAKFIHQSLESATGQQLIPWQLKLGYFNSNNVQRSANSLFVSRIKEGKYIPKE
ncbi:S8/S53 family peptidase [Muriicola sp. Z0-33]|uniref:S8/S53 family peptidase n=1 Tax=Muriicola sp. Z0-33 TaxID=2816957 RepID=UPI002238A7FD|nr:S8/S53 family peptidase [Muriicola sp. Z0-33]MCW5516250.1 S8/S53 family peptidase [Muriicola sp. Z0-33]